MSYPTPQPLLCHPFRSAVRFLAAGLCAGSAFAQTSAEATGEDVVTLPEFSVSTSTDTGYLATASTSGEILEWLRSASETAETETPAFAAMSR